MAHVSGPTRWAFSRHDVVARGNSTMDRWSERSTYSKRDTAATGEQ